MAQGTAALQKQLDEGAAARKVLEEQLDELKGQLQQAVASGDQKLQRQESDRQAKEQKLQQEVAAAKHAAEEVEKAKRGLEQRLETLQVGRAVIECWGLLHEY